MKSRTVFFTILLFALTQCKDTTVTNYINEDGSIDRKVVRKTEKNSSEEFIVPVDSTWKIVRSFEVDTIVSNSDSGNTTSYDTINCITATKHYKNFEELNLDYKNVKSEFRGDRSAKFEKHFQWFFTTYEYSEKISGLTNEFPPEQEFTAKELSFIYLTEEQKNDSIKLDSLKYNDFFEELSKKAEKWQNKCFISIAKNDLYKILTQEYGVDKKTTNEIIKGIDNINIEENTSDSIIKSLIPDYLNINKDSVMSKLSQGKIVGIFNNEYDMIFKLPGKLISTNGHITENEEIQWKSISPSRYLSSDFIMVAKSRKANYWTWAISLVFVIAAFWFFRKK